jgi:hypothetical protein
VIPVRRNPFVLVFLPVWLLGWAALGGASAARRIMAPEGPGGGRLFLAVWLTVWTLAVVRALGAWLWTAMGREIVALTPSSLRLRFDVAGLGYARVYELVQVRNLRVTTPPAFPPLGWGTRGPFGINGLGSIAFDYGATTVRFGSSLDESEAAMVVADLKARHRFQDQAA